MRGNTGRFPQAWLGANDAVKVENKTLFYRLTDLKTKPISCQTNGNFADELNADNPTV